MTGDTGQFRRVGILGGMGVEATIALMQRVSAATAAEDDQDHVPMFVDMNPQVPSRIRHIIAKDGPDPGPVLAQMAARLENAGAQALAMPCNTAHLYAPAITQAVGIPLLHMPALACAQAASGLMRGDTVGILASPATNATGLFGDLLAKDGIKAAFPEDETDILASIRRIKKQGPTSADIALLEQEAAKLAQSGARCVIVGCSEFSLVSKQLRAAVPIIDTLDVLTDAIIAFSGVQAKSDI
ncbi:aspartate/glutamate racemase family protein [Yoonia sp.]|uniref:aspartate/glutamate racemase family protein n=1 Tax=Yoonia sp. TaxID=2212373 RepID=UPI003F6CEAA7